MPVPDARYIKATGRMTPGFIQVGEMPCRAPLGPHLVYCVVPELCTLISRRNLQLLDGVADDVPQKHDLQEAFPSWIADNQVEILQVSARLATKARNAGGMPTLLAQQVLWKVPHGSTRDLKPPKWMLKTATVSLKPTSRKIAWTFRLQFKVRA